MEALPFNPNAIGVGAHADGVAVNHVSQDRARYKLISRQHEVLAVYEGILDSQQAMAPNLEEVAL